MCLLSNRWIQEKFAGFRAFWDGKDKLISINGKEIVVDLPSEKLAEFFRSFPSVPLDGELW